MNKEELLNELKSEDKNRIRDAILHLQKYEEDDVIEAIINTMLKHKSKQILSAGIDILLNFTSKKDVIANNVLKLLYSDSPKLRHAGIDLLISCGDEAVKAVREKIVKDDDFNIRKYGLDVLKEIKTEESLEVLRALANDENPNVRYSAIEFLMNFTSYKEKIVEIIREIIKKETFDNLYSVTTIASTIIYGNFFDESFIPILKEKLKSINDDLIKHWIYKILIYLKDKEIINEALENAKKVDMLKVIENDIEMVFNKGR